MVKAPWKTKSIAAAPTPAESCGNSQFLDPAVTIFSGRLTSYRSLIVDLVNKCTLHCHCGCHDRDCRQKLFKVSGVTDERESSTNQWTASYSVNKRLMGGQRGQRFHCVIREPTQGMNEATKNHVCRKPLIKADMCLSNPMLFSKTVPE